MYSIILLNENDNNMNYVCELADGSARYKKGGIS